MSLYVRVYTAFYTHRKTLRLKAALGDDAFWVPPRLWSYAATNQPDGDFKSYTANEIAVCIGYSKDATAMLQALLQAGFLDKDMKIHDWAEHNGCHKVFAERAKKAASARWEKERAKERGNTVQEEEGRREEPSIASSIAQASYPPKNGFACPKFPKDYRILIQDARDRRRELKDRFAPTWDHAEKEKQEFNELGARIKHWRSEEMKLL